MSKKGDSPDKQRSGLSSHKRDGSRFDPPFKQVPNMSPSSWKDDRLPEILWAALIVGQMSREAALDYFRYVLKFAQDNKIEDLTLSGISSLDDDKKRKLLAHMVSYSGSIQELLRPLMLLNDLPSVSFWGEVLPKANPENDWGTLAESVLAVFEHQTQEATDCRWVKLMAGILSGKLRIPADRLKELLEYPNLGDQRFVRPFIRASEIAFPSKDKTWPNKFWTQCHNDTHCIYLPEKEVPEESFHLSSWQLNHIRDLLVEYFIYTDKSTAVDPKHDAIFGITIFSLTLLEEQVATNLSRGSLARVVLRNVAEAYITLSYLLAKNDPDLWLRYRDYGIGQIKLASLKFDEMKPAPDYFNTSGMREFANEDRWEEFSSIDVGNWDKQDLRKMSEEANCKNIYEKYFTWPSSYTHSGWGAVRESVMTVCGNVLHRLHLIPKKHPTPMNSTLTDAVSLMNGQLDLLQRVYPEFDLRITDEKKLAVQLLSLTIGEIAKKKNV